MSDLTSNQDDLPSSWLHTELGRVVNYGRTTKVEPSDIPVDAWVLELEDIEKDSSRILQRMTFSQRQSKSTKNKFLAGDVLYGKLRPYLNKVVIADQPGYCTTEIVPITAGLLDNRFLFYWLKHPEFLKYVEAESHGLNMPRLGTETGKAAPFVLAPRQEQTRIADQLDTLLAQINACHHRLDTIPALLKRFQQAVLDAATTGALTEDWREGNNSPAWKPVVLSDIAEVVGGVTKDSKKQSTSDEEVPYLRVANVQRGYLDLAEVKTIRVPAAKLEKLLLEPGDVLFNEGGDLDKLGRGWVWDGQIDRCTFQNHVFRARLKDPRHQPKFISWWGNSRGLDYFIRSGKQTTNLASINKRTLEHLPISLPCPEEQQEIVCRADSLLRLAACIEARLTNMRTLARRLAPQALAKAFRGELVPQNPEDEPASALLERITDASAKRATISKLEKQPRRPEVKPVSDEPLLNVIDQFDQVDFTFDELRQATSLGYEALKNELFALLANPKSGVAQHFDAKEKTMKLRRVRK